MLLLLLLLLNRFSHVRLCATLLTAAQQAPPSLGFSRQEHWSGLPFPSSVHKSEKWKVKVKLPSQVWLLATPWTAAYQAPLSIGFSRQEYWSGVPLPSPKNKSIGHKNSCSFCSCWACSWLVGLRFRFWHLACWERNCTMRRLWPVEQVKDWTILNWHDYSNIVSSDEASRLNIPNKNL